MYGIDSLHTCHRLTFICASDSFLRCHWLISYMSLTHFKHHWLISYMSLIYFIHVIDSFYTCHWLISYMSLTHFKHHWFILYISLTHFVHFIEALNSYIIDTVHKCYWSLNFIPFFDSFNTSLGLSWYIIRFFLMNIIISCFFSTIFTVIK